MKKFILLSLGLLFFLANVSAQTCATPDHTPAERAYFLNTIKNYMVVKNSGTTCIPIKPYVFREDDSSGGVSLEDLTKGIANLNHKYLEAGIEFYYSSAPSYIDNSDLNNFSEEAPDNDTEAQIITAAGEVTNAVNIYFVESITISTVSGPFNAAGYAYFPNSSTNSNRILMIHSATSGSPNGTFTHEFGHYFALPHTHSGTENGSGHANAENVPRTGANANCSTNGDSFCDTDADPRYSNADFNFGTCSYTGAGTDINGVAYNPLTAVTNIMSYYPDACVSEFTPDQYTAIAQGLVARQGFTNYNYTAPPMTVSAPTGLTVFVNGLGAYLNWTDNASNEMGYIIEMSTTSATMGFQAVTEGGTDENATSFGITDNLTASTTYYFRVKASNGDCNSYSNVVSGTTPASFICAASANQGNDEFISNVTLGAFTNTTGSDNYTYYSALSADLTVGTPSAYSVTNPGNAGGGGNGYTQDTCAIWIDWNQDGDFDDMGENVVKTGGVGPYTGNITPPATALSGATIMRVRIHFNNEDTDPCGTTVWGEVEDYNINVVSTAPNFSVADDNMSGFTYVSGGGPSTSQTNSITWANLVSSVTSLNTVNYFEFSTTGGAPYTPASMALNIAIPPFPTTFGPQNIEVRLISGLSAGTYLDTIYLSTSDGMAGTIADTVYLSGSVTTAPCSELFFSEYIEGSSNNKCIEIYNPTSASVDLAAGNYQVTRYSNGSPTVSSTLNLTGILASGDVYVACNSSSTAPFLAIADVTSGVAGWNGDDAVALVSNGTIVDVIGQIGTDPGSAWTGSGVSTANQTLTRKPSILAGDSDGSNAFDPSIQWNSHTQDYIDSLGIHITSCVAVCSIDELAANAQTACVPATNTYTQEVTVTYSTAPASGTLDVNGQSFTIGTSPQLVTLTGLTADGAAVNVSASFSANATCSLDSVALFTAPANCSPTCNISGITAGAQTACVPATNTYTQSVTVSYATPPASGTLDINGQSFAITSSPQTEILTGLTADGNAVNVTAVFSADGTCTFTANSLFTATADCTPATPCSQLLISEYGEPSSGNGKYIEIYNPTSATVDLSNYRVWKISNGGNWPEQTFNLSGMLVSGGTWVVGNNIIDVPASDQLSTGTMNFNGDDAVGIAYNGGSGSTFSLIDAVGTDGPDPGSGFAVAGTNGATANRTLNRKTTIQVPNTDWTSSAGTNTTDSEWILNSYSQSDLGSHVTACVAVCSIDALAANSQTACVPATNTYTQEITVTYSTAPASGTLDVNGQSFTIGTSPQLVTLTGLTADGAAVNVSASFSANATCSLDSVALFTAPANCSPTCNISGITAGAQTACVPATNTYTQSVTVSYATPPASGTLDINGQSFAITSSPQTEILTGLTADGNAVNVTAVFSADGTCTFTANSLFTATADCTPATPCSQLLISEYGEPSSGNGKYIEIYNPTSATVDLSNYRVWKISNGGNWPEQTFNLSGMLVSGGTWVVGNNIIDVPASDQLSTGTMNFNGDDAVGIAYNGGSGSTFSLIDAVGTDGPDPGSGFAVAGTNGATANRTLNRKTTIQVPNTDWTSSAGTNTTDSEWILNSYSQSDLGSHVTACVTLTFDWTGTTDTDWNTASNWSSGIVPSSSDDVTIPDVSSMSGNFPVITPSISLGDIQVDINATLTISTGIVLEGTFTNDGTVILQDGAYLDDFSSPSSFVGNIIVETTAANGVANDQRFISSPVNSPNISEIGDDLVGPWGTGLPGANGMAITVDDCALQTVTATSNYGNLFELNETIMASCPLDGWVVRSSGALENGRGYSAYLANGSTFDFEGTPNTGIYNVATTNSGNGVVDGDGWNLIGNPYPSPISRDDVILAGAADAQYFVTTGIYQGSFSPYLPTSNIAIAQGFQVQVAASTNLLFDNSFRNTNAATWYANENWFIHKLEVSVLGATSADKTILFYNDDATSSYEPMYDVSKRKSKLGNPSISTVGASKELALNGMSINDIGNSVPMNLYPGTNGSFELMFEGMETFSANTTIYVKDLMLDVVHNIADGNYTFSSNTNDVAERFEIIFVPEVEFSVLNPDCEGNYGRIDILTSIGIEDRSFDLLFNGDLMTSSQLEDFGFEFNVTGNFEINVTDIYGGIQSYSIEVVTPEILVSDFLMPYEVEVGETFTLLNLCSNATNVEWGINNTSLVNINTPTYSFDEAGVYEISLEVSNADCSDSKSETITVSNKTTGIGNLNTDKIEIYPNPVSDVLNIVYQDDIIVEIYTILGEKVLESEMKNVSVKSLASGIYVVHISNDKKEVLSINKLVKE